MINSIIPQKKFDSLNVRQGAWYIKVPEQLLGWVNPRFKEKLSNEWNHNLDSKKKLFTDRAISIEEDSKNVEKDMNNLYEDIERFFNKKNETLNDITRGEIGAIVKKVFLKGSIIGLFSLTIANAFSSGQIAFYSTFNLCSFISFGILICGLYRIYRDIFKGERIKIPFEKQISSFIQKVAFPGSLIGIGSLATMYAFFSVEFFSIFNMGNSIVLGMSVCLLYRVCRDLYHCSSIRF